MSLVLSPALQAGKSADNSRDPAEKLRQIVAVLRMAWKQDFQTNFRKYMLGSAPTVVLISSAEMKRIAAGRLDGRQRDGETTQGLTIDDKSNIRIVRPKRWVFRQGHGTGRVVA